MFVSIRVMLSIVMMIFSTLTYSDTLLDAERAFESKDYEKAYRMYSTLGEQGNPLAQAYLGYMYENGLGVREYLKDAYFWYEKSAEQGNGYAQFKLSQAYRPGSLYRIADEEKALNLLFSAAEDGHARALNNLSVVYADATLGVSENLVLAYMYAKLAADRGDLVAKNKLASNNLPRQMSASEISAAIELANSWNVGHRLPR
ncbi:tetratricopeptide repeat protein [Vreelandella rituensis]|uniref:Sel1 repeat family protein n=1 Tax=Vreelandella rituensis TaxID=2282306 RepID=A0A368U9M1_9GAMM|nr:tetratricopeptide repeat protein [Halomonas rituensis]RCV93601.1 sel1 repeat family protein [Halomonas rituensis]